MPLKDGVQFCDTLRNDEPTSQIPIVLLRARAAFSDQISGLRRGADAYLTKPFQREEVQVVLSNLLQSRRVLQIHYSQRALPTSLTETAPSDGIDSLQDQFLHKLRLVLEPQLDNANGSIETLCQQLGMSRASRHRKMTALTGMALTRYVWPTRYFPHQA
ncbi:hypothetical protein GCM10028807_62260 [Spirosoma daeguense]